MKFRKLNLPPNYYINEERQGTLPCAEELNIYDKEIPNASNSKLYPHKQVARICMPTSWGGSHPRVVYWEMGSIHGDSISCNSLEAAMCHVEAMAGMGLLGHGYKKGMLNETC